MTWHNAEVYAQISRMGRRSRANRPGPTRRDVFARGEIPPTLRRIGAGGIRALDHILRNLERRTTWGQDVEVIDVGRTFVRNIDEHAVD